ncbi:hypothetical protein EOE67_15615 [Rheinheimera riviphila]|jgi:acetolactate synthase small subunit|uniref:Motility protein n=1 Tax=Rheinheimera riviphila TaxID=1834037 RepID=A0A437QIE0_9GAMM|nr:MULTISPECIES: hypothetical protein [Rheinheimera]RVU34299.1 hypothetical protein EOE67_15615 [Rheinheimera riviphila]
MTEGIGGAAVSQGYEMLSLALAKTQQKQEGKMTMQLLESATTASPASSPVGNLGQNIDLRV